MKVKLMNTILLSNIENNKIEDNSSNISESLNDIKWSTHFHNLKAIEITTNGKING